MLYVQYNIKIPCDQYYWYLLGGIICYSSRSLDFFTYLRLRVNIYIRLLFVVKCEVVMCVSGWGGGSAVELRARPPGALTPVWSSRKLCLHVTTALDSSPRLRAQVSSSVTHSLPLFLSLSLCMSPPLSVHSPHTSSSLRTI